jgi:ribokinase
MVELICLGAINWDINLFMERLPRNGEEVPVKEIQRVSGGTAANVCVVAFIGALGDDRIAEEQIRILVDEGVDPSGILIIHGEESGQAYISISEDGANEIHTYFGANLRITGDHIADEERLGLIKGTKVCVIMDPPIETAKRMAEECRRYGVKVIWDPGVYAKEGLPVLLPTLANVDYFILNHIEYENLLGTSDPRTVLRDLGRATNDMKCIIKHGADGSILCEDDGTIIQMEAAPLADLGLKVVNTVGCGDAFIGGFAAGLVEGLSHINALRQASAAGSYKATKIETRGGPTKDQLEQLLNLWKDL